MSTRTASFGVLLTLAAALAGCGDFWQNPNGTTSTGGTATTTTLTASSTTTSAGSPVTLTATVSPAAATGTVTFYGNSTEVGTATLTSGSASGSVTFSAAGTESVTATYSGDSTYASSTSSAVTITVTAAAASGSSFTGALNADRTGRLTNLVTDPAGAWTVTATSHVESLARVAIDGDTILNIDGEGHCVYYSGSLFPASGTKNATGVYALPSGGFVAPEGTPDLDCD